MKSVKLLQVGERLQLNIKGLGAAFMVRTIDEGDSVYIEVFDYFNDKTVYENHIAKENA